LGFTGITALIPLYLNLLQLLVILEIALFYRLYVLVCVDSYSDKHTNPEDELWLSGQSANTVMVGGGFPLPPFSR